MAGCLLFVILMCSLHEMPVQAKCFRCLNLTTDKTLDASLGLLRDSCALCTSASHFNHFLVLRNLMVGILKMRTLTHTMCTPPSLRSHLHQP
ncbi:uncharacterized protein LOC120783151 isoform X2 [Xiphias gladius]|uniref:uncharacterized protein LOC120783151 isoform X2 n=1 Tax=Xiphias gladius TaxID=8245 RepID=UPI001A97F19C|nr:uncharacterized protein LOC120783151 isoform X2 [Xiphias gladius]